MGCAPWRFIPTPTRACPSCARGRLGGGRSAGHAARESYLDQSKSVGDAAQQRRGAGDSSRLRLPVGECGIRGSGDCEPGWCMGRRDRRDDPRHGSERCGSKKLMQQGGRAVTPGLSRRGSDRRRLVKAEADTDRLSGADQGGGGRRRQGHARGGTRPDLDDAPSPRQARGGRPAFGDDRVLSEKFMHQPRHIEVQIIRRQPRQLLCICSSGTVPCSAGTRR